VSQSARTPTFLRVLWRYVVLSQTFEGSGALMELQYNRIGTPREERGWNLSKSPNNGILPHGVTAVLKPFRERRGR
jgi:hypothetical protein